MKIVYIHQYFNKDKSSTRSYEIAKHLVAKGHQVTMITGNDVASCDGIHIISTKTPYNQEYGYIRRMFSFLLFMLKSFIYAIREKNVDLIYATSTPLTVGLVGKWVSQCRKITLIFEVRDLWPDVPIKLGIIKNKLLVKLLYCLEASIYEQASKIIALSDGMKQDLIEKDIAAEKIDVITNFADIDGFKTVSKEEQTSILTKYPILQNKFICLYAGTLGYVNHVEYVLKLAKLTKNTEIIYAIVGKGKEKEQLVQAAREQELHNVIFVDEVSKRIAMSWMKLSDIGMCFVRDAEVLDRNSQNKLFDFWAAGKPTLINYKGWQDKVMRDGSAGQGFYYDEAERMARHIEALSFNQEIYTKLQKNVEKLATIYKKDKQIEQLTTILEKTIKMGAKSI
ncbi:glycosyltransferase family 4 protein [Listeria grandensis]|uniref:Glycosyltransferase family 4 protein n=1 Tax=Listeria grandensis TaxID=1494963 RepID=A0A7X1CPU1_9LIST|nr:glycosyltransferase family 4 protein [Listeria grandensis]MBC1936340.1 glycosyltransferase family 4 protein [Listeria grandensis]